jgi:two-component system response regulator AtoC
MQEIYELLPVVAQSKSTVLIEGESGTGKELIAEAIHLNSPRRTGPFIKVNCAALAEGILESELFGHVKGAFTGAITDKKGRFELAHKGTIFLDEIGEISPHTQVKLLRVLQEEEFERVGGTESVKVDVRIIAATNKDLTRAMEKGEFRGDLYYRLRVVPIHLPPLRERKDDIPHLIKHFVSKLNKEMDKEINNVSPKVMDFLMDYDYKGNIRELENILEHAFVRCQGNTILAEHLPKDLFGAAVKLPENIIADSDNPLMAIERGLILKMLNQHKWKQGEVAKKLHISRVTLWRKIKQLKIEKDTLQHHVR